MSIINPGEDAVTKMFGSPKQDKLLSKAGAPIIDANAIAARKANEDAKKKHARFTKCIVAISRKVRELEMNMQEVMVVLDAIRDACKNEAFRETKINDYVFTKTKESEEVMLRLSKEAE